MLSYSRSLPFLACFSTRISASRSSNFPKLSSFYNTTNTTTTNISSDIFRRQALHFHTTSLAAAASSPRDKPGRVPPHEPRRPDYRCSLDILSRALTFPLASLFDYPNIMSSARSNKRSAPDVGLPALGLADKRLKKSDFQKYYAVRVGSKPGVYLTWPECSEQINGFPGAVYKSFLTRTDAEAFVAGQNPATPRLGHNGSSRDTNKEKYYAVARGAYTGIFPTWEEASPAITGMKGPKYKRFDSRPEAVDFIEQFGDAETVARVKEGGGGTWERARAVEADRAAAAANKAAGAATATTGKRGTRSGQQQLGQGQGAGVGDDGVGDPVEIYTDGSSLANGRVGAVAGVGVFFGLSDSRNVSERLKGEPQTNQRAELTAILRALEIVSPSQHVQIYTDSQYAINCVTSWYLSWQRRGWQTAAGGDVKNRDLVQAVRERIEEREKKRARTIFTWVKGHSDSVGNTAADRLAVAGARK